MTYLIMNVKRRKILPLIQKPSNVMASEVTALELGSIESMVIDSVASFLPFLIFRLHLRSCFCDLSIRFDSR